MGIRGFPSVQVFSAELLAKYTFSKESSNRLLQP
jgi:hypothetical protein